MSESEKENQPPSGGCVLKLFKEAFQEGHHRQPPSGGCVLKRDCAKCYAARAPQPPSGGCVLKLGITVQKHCI